MFLGASGTKRCPVAALISYLVVRASVKGQLFAKVDSKPLWRTVFVGRLQKGLQVEGLEKNWYSCVATSAAAAGVPDHLIKILGRWQSEA